MRGFVASLAGLMVVAGLATAASAATITTPSSNPFTVPGNAGGQPLSFTVTASGYPAGNSEVSIEQCDGVSPSSASFDPLNDCDSATAPSAVDVGANGIANFPANDTNFGFFPFKGLSPTNKFNCVAPGETMNNGKPTYSNCQARVAIDLNAKNAGTDAYLTLTLPATPTTGPRVVGGCSGEIQLVKANPGLTDQTQNGVKESFALAKDKANANAPIGGHCSGVVRPGDPHLPAPPASLTPKSMSGALLGNTTCASGNDLAHDATSANAYVLNGKMTVVMSQTYVDLTTGLTHPYKLQAAIAVLGNNAGAGPDVLDIGGIVLTGLNQGALVSGNIWQDPVVASKSASTAYNTGYNLDLGSIGKCADNAGGDVTPIKTLLSGSGNDSPLGTDASQTTGMVFTLG